MRRKREFTEDAFYHVTSRTNNKIRVFENNLGRKIMLIVLQDAQNKFRFGLTNFCVMPTHIHLLIKPAEGQNLSVIMRWIKTRSAVRDTRLHRSHVGRPILCPPRKGRSGIRICDELHRPKPGQSGTCTGRAHRRLVCRDFPTPQRRRRNPFAQGDRHFFPAVGLSASFYILTPAATAGAPSL